MIDNEILYLDNEGYSEHLKKIEKYIIDLEKLNEQIKMLKNTDFENEELIELNIKKKKIQRKILNERSKKIVVIEKKINDEFLDRGLVKINTYYESEPEEEICELVTSESTIDGDIEKTNINGPKGKILYGSKVGDTKYFSINGKSIKVDIIEKINVRKLVK